jgi:thermostable 8-oxoguanine DNA glycosylase
MGLSNRELQFRLFYSIIVAGKNAKFAENVTKKLFRAEKKNPFNVVKEWVEQGSLEEKLREAKTGNYTKMVQSFSRLVEADIDLRTCEPADLERVHGIGPKTARFFIIWTRPDAHCAALDVHVLRWLKNQGHDVPKSTPPAGPTYSRIEQLFLDEAEKRGVANWAMDIIETLNWMDVVESLTSLGAVPSITLRNIT